MATKLAVGGLGFSNMAHTSSSALVVGEDVTGDAPFDNDCGRITGGAMSGTGTLARFAGFDANMLSSALN